MRWVGKNKYILIIYNKKLSLLLFLAPSSKSLLSPKLAIVHPTFENYKSTNNWKRKRVRFFLAGQLIQNEISRINFLTYDIQFPRLNVMLFAICGLIVWQAWLYCALSWSVSSALFFYGQIARYFRRLLYPNIDGPQSGNPALNATQIVEICERDKQPLLQVIHQFHCTLSLLLSRFFSRKYLAYIYLLLNNFNHFSE